MDHPKTTATRQFAGLVLAPIAPGQLGTLRTLLARAGQETIAAMRGHAAESVLVPFHALDTVHYARFVLLDDPGGGSGWLAFCTDYDGPEGDATCSEADAWKHHVRDLLAHAREGLTQIFECCEGYRRGELERYLEQHRRRAATFYVGASGRSKRQILWEASLRARVEQVLGECDLREALPEVVRERVVGALGREGTPVSPFPAQPDRSSEVRWFWVRLAVVAALLLGTFIALIVHFSGWSVPAAALAALSGVFVLALAAVARFRYLELTDPQFQPEYSHDNLEQFQTASTDENHFLQNQLTHLVEVKPGLLRWLVIRAVFAVLQVLAHGRYNKGKLGDIPSIHFARWVLVPGRRVLFFSNFDSSWQSYLGDFIDRASGGLTSVWSNTIGYPRTRWLRQAGSEDASRFLAWTRRHQLPTQVWYCAYPGLSIVNVNANTEIRRGLGDRTALDAATWLFRLRAVDRVRTDQLFGEEQTRDPSLALGDIQGLILWGYGHMPEARFLLLRLVGPVSDALLRWLGNLPINSAAGDAPSVRPPEPLVNIAFTYQGLLALGVDPALCARFSTAFCQSSDHPYRTRVNGDVGPSAPQHWEWGSSANPVHLALLVYASCPANADRFARQLVAQARQHGLDVAAELEATTLADRKEHFGFRDGIAQPTIQGSGRAELQGNTVAAGEFLLGHRDGYRNVTHSPSSDNGFNVGLNGSYLVLRQLEQNVEDFWRYCQEQSHGDALRLASKMVGRWPSGAPLVRHPTEDPNDPRFADEDDFSYVANDEDNDRYGARCPFGSHVRRANPRDWALSESREESQRLSNLHRIIRRGRPYGKPLDPELSVPAMIGASLGPAPVHDRNGSGNGSGNGSAHVAERRGLQFLCFNSNIDRQFEFIQQQWCNNPKFAGLASDPDPLLGLARPPEELGTSDLGFTPQSDVKSGLDGRCGGLRQFVKVVGSSYFFMPSLPALRLLGAGLLARAGSEEGAAHLRLESPPPDEQLYVDRLIEDLGNKIKRDYVFGKTLRDGHPKMHGCVQAVFRVHPGLPSELAVGLFARPQAYRAWVRFSNENGRVGSDAAADVRGVAIKLVGVDGFKLLEGQESCRTHDFVLTTREGFMAKDVAEFSALIGAFVRGRLPLAWFSLRHPRVALGVRSARERHTSPLAPRYFSGVPYLLGQHAAKYALTLAAPRELPRLAASGPEHLREALKLALGQGDVRLDFAVQLRPDAGPRSVEDSRVPWAEADAPFRTVATLEIPAQDFDTPERQEFGENLSFNPWRCLPEHRPLGGINRARRQVYRALSALRHGRNAAPSIEPDVAIGEGPTPEAPPRRAEAQVLLE